jgi:hypothetical protein
LVLLVRIWVFNRFALPEIIRETAFFVPLHRYTRIVNSNIICPLPVQSSLGRIGWGLLLPGIIEDPGSLSECVIHNTAPWGLLEMARISLAIFIKLTAHCFNAHALQQCGIMCERGASNLISSSYKGKPVGWQYVWPHLHRILLAW